jgi:ATP diphosphatase
MTVEKLREIMTCLRDPIDGCPWDLQQDFRSIAPYAIEEAYEVVDAIENGTLNDLCDELGDLLLQVVFHSQMASEQGAFTFDDVVEGICNKMTRRHPHVFSTEKVADADDVKRIWEAEKQKERDAKGGQTSVLDGIPMGMPALTRAVKQGKKAAKVGFDWPEAAPVFDKINEELKELKAELAASQPNPKAVESELGDVLHAVSQLARKLKVDPEAALRGTNQRFDTRFRNVEQQAALDDVALAALSLDELEARWQQAKKRVATVP